MNKKHLFFPLCLPDKKFSAFIIVFILFGIISLLSAASYESELLSNSPFYFILQHCFTLIIAIGALLFFTFVNYQYLRPIGLLICLACIVFLLLVNFSPLGIKAGGSERWLNLFFITFQPSELAKLGIILLMADGLTRGHALSKPVIARLLICLSIILLVLIEPDLGSAILLSSYVLFLLFVRGINLLILIPTVSSLLFLAWQIVNSNNYQKARITAWLEPEKDPLGIGYNLMQSKYAIADGGLLGVGFGNSFYKFGYLPVSYADFIFPIICEELGILGSLSVILIFLILIYYGFKFSIKAPCSFGKFIGLACVFALGVQAIFNLGGVTGVLPITGVPLPLISYGKTSLIIVMCMLGILLNLSRYNVLKQKLMRLKAI